MKNQQWVIITKDKCVWCDRVKELLRERQITFKEFNIIDNDQLAEFVVACGLRTVPQVYANGTHVGGYMETKAAFDINGAFE